MINEPSSRRADAPTNSTKENHNEYHQSIPQYDGARPRTKKPLNPALIVVIVIASALLLSGLVFGIIALFRNKSTYHVEEYLGSPYYIIDGDYNGEYDLQFKTFSDEELFDDYYVDYEDEEDATAIDEDDEEDTLVVQGEEKEYYENEDSESDEHEEDNSTDENYSNYDDLYPNYYPEAEGIYDYESYKDFCEKWGYKQKYTDTTKRYVVLADLEFDSEENEVRLAHVAIDSDNVLLYIWEKAEEYEYDIEEYYEDDNEEEDNDSEEDESEDKNEDEVRDEYENDYVAYLIVVPIDNNMVTDVTTISLMTKEEFERIKQGSGTDVFYVDKKPIIYLYPEKEAEVSVELGRPDLLTASYPKYTNSWSVLAKPSGALIDLSTGRELYSLYYESKAVKKPELTEGFVIKGTDSAKFLEEKLATLGLNDREAEEFIIYWLPELEKSPYNLIRFETAEEIAKNMPLNVYPNPDTIIRVFMDYEPLEESIEITEQTLESPTRNGFTVVEWGGSKL